MPPGELPNGCNQSVQITQTRKQVRRHAYALVDGDRENAVLVVEVVCYGLGLLAFDPDIRDPAGLMVLQRRIDNDFGEIQNTLHPVVLEVAQPFFFALGAQAFVKLDGLEKSLLDGNRVGSDVLELADIVLRKDAVCE